MAVRIAFDILVHSVRLVKRDDTIHRANVNSGLLSLLQQRLPRRLRSVKPVLEIKRSNNHSVKEVKSVLVPHEPMGFRIQQMLHLAIGLVGTIGPIVSPSLLNSCISGQ